jgi:hypothetical protein
LSGLVLWILYLIVGEARVAWATVAVLGAVAVLGLIMAARWIPVYRGYAAQDTPLARIYRIPPERNFPLPVVAHGILAITPSCWCCSPRLALAGGD